MIPPPNAARYASTFTSVKRAPSARNGVTLPFCLCCALVSRTNDLFDLSGKVAVLTGVASGIGKATALRLSSAGATIVGGDIDDAGAEATAKEIMGEGGKAVTQRVDVTRRAEIDALLDRAQSEFGRVDIMGNIAGIP